MNLAMIFLTTNIQVPVSVRICTSHKVVWSETCNRKHKIGDTTAKRMIIRNFIFCSRQVVSLVLHAMGLPEIVRTDVEERGDLEEDG